MRKVHITAFVAFAAALCQSGNNQKWIQSIDIDQFSDDIVLTAIYNSDSAFIKAKCAGDNKFDLVVSLNRFFGPNITSSVRYRFDKAEIKSTKWPTSTKGDAAFVDDKDKMQFVSKLTTAKDLLVEISDYNGTPYQRKFILSDSVSALKSVLNKCKINPGAYLLSNIDEKLFEVTSTWGPKNTSCQKKMLKYMNYKISDISQEKNEELYKALQSFIDDKAKECEGTSFGSRYRYECKDKYRFAMQIYSFAKEMNEDFKSECGILKRSD